MQVVRVRVTERVLRLGSAAFAVGELVRPLEQRGGAIGGEQHPVAATRGEVRLERLAAHERELGLLLPDP